MRRVALILLLAALGGCSQFRLGAEAVKGAIPAGQDVGIYKVGKPYTIDGQVYIPQESFSYDETGIASWYGDEFHGRKTANGERFHKGELTAAHRTLQMPSFVRVTNLSNGKSVVARVNDRGPFAKGRIIDVSEHAASLLGFKNHGTARVRVQVLPEASRQVAQAAREGRAWRGDLPVEPTPVLASNTPRPFEPSGQPVPVHAVNGVYFPDPVVTPQPVPASTSLFIQAGSFATEDNAVRLQGSLQTKGRAFVVPVAVGGKTFYRVRLGPYATVSDADNALKRVSPVASDARIVVE